MTIPFIILAVLAACGGLINVPVAMGGNEGLATFLDPIFADSAIKLGAFHLDHSVEYILMAVSGLSAVIVAILAYRTYVSKSAVPEPDLVPRGFFERLSYHKFYVDELYNEGIVKQVDEFSRFAFRFIDKKSIDEIVSMLAGSVGESGKEIRI